MHPVRERSASPLHPSIGIILFSGLGFDEKHSFIHQIVTSLCRATWHCILTDTGKLAM